MCKIIVMANQKGGVAKTSSTRNLAYSLAELGKKVLAVDFDPQTNLTISFGVAPAALQETAASLMMKLVMDEVLPEKASYILNIGKVDLLPSKKTLTVAEVNLLIERKDDCLAKLLAPLRADYDYILVDTGPSLGSLTINAFTAADEIIIPVDPELFALVGLKELTETISKIKQNLNPKVEIIGILFTKCSKRTTLYRQTSEQVRSVFGHLPIFESQIPATVQVGTANSKGLSVMELDAKSPAAAAYMNLAKEVLAYAYSRLLLHQVPGPCQTGRHHRLYHQQGYPGPKGREPAGIYRTTGRVHRRHPSAQYGVQGAGGNRSDRGYCLFEKEGGPHAA